MVQTIPGVLAQIVERKRVELETRKHLRSQFERQAETNLADRRRFAEALSTARPAIIAEMKKASPSKGVLSHDFDPRRIAAMYRRGGASALSVLTDEQFFQGRLADLQEARAEAGLPALRKDFTFDEFHVVESAAHGTDAILLIVAILTVAELRRYRELAEQYAMDTLVEVHDETELAMAVDSGARIVGVNNRNLHDFSVSLETSIRIAERIPPEVLKVSESGIHCQQDVRRLQDAGYQAFLVGEHLMKSGDPVAALEALRDCEDLRHNQ